MQSEWNRLWFAEKFVSLLIEQHPLRMRLPTRHLLWFAEKFVSLLIEQHRLRLLRRPAESCDLLKNSYLCLLNNTCGTSWNGSQDVVICWKIRIFAYWTTPTHGWEPRGYPLWFAEKFVSLLIEQHLGVARRPLVDSCDLLKNSYLCLLNNTIKTR